MALDRQRIERKDFPIGRRGYDPDAVDAHLNGLADEFDEFKRSSRKRSESLAAAASEQVRSIVEAAETSAAEIQRQAEDEARDIRAEASGEAQTTREQATSQAREYVGNVSESTATMLDRLEAMQNELNALFESLRTGSNRLNADLQLLGNNLDEVRDAVAPRPRFEPEAPAQPVSAASPAPAQPVSAASPAPATSGPVSAASVAPAPNHGSTAPTPDPASPDAQGGADVLWSGALEPDEGTRPHGDALAESTAGGSTEDAEGARLVALNMALNQTSREETERFLAENFRVSDLRGLLDEVYASIDS